MKSHFVFGDLLAACVALAKQSATEGADGESLFFPNCLDLASVLGEVADVSVPSGKPARIVQTLFGLFGPNGALSYEQTEWLYELSQHKPGRPIRDLLDIFHHALTASRLHDNFLGHIGTGFLGRHSLNTAAGLYDLAERLLGLDWPGELPRDLLVRYFNYLLEIPSQAALERLLSDYFGISVRVQPFRPILRRLQPRHAGRLGGRETIVDPLGGVIVQLGPLDEARYQDFLPRPHGSPLQPLLQIARVFLGDGMATEVLLLGDESAHEINTESELRTHCLDSVFSQRPRVRRLPRRRWERIPARVCQAVEQGDYHAAPDDGVKRFLAMGDDFR